jgi:phage host-nuclease inhibitor protein Gam
MSDEMPKVDGFFSDANDVAGANVIGSNFRVSSITRQIWGLEAIMAENRAAIQKSVKAHMERLGMPAMRKRIDELREKLRDEVTHAGQMEMPL